MQNSFLRMAVPGGAKCLKLREAVKASGSALPTRRCDIAASSCAITPVRKVCEAPARAHVFAPKQCCRNPSQSEKQAIGSLYSQGRVHMNTLE